MHKRTNKTPHNVQTVLWNVSYKKFQNPRHIFQDVFYSTHSPLWFIFDFEYTHFPAFYGASFSMGGVPLICGFPNLGTVSTLSSLHSRVLLQLNIGLCQRHNTLLRAWVWAHCWQGFGFGHFNLPANLGGQLVVTWTPSDQCQVLGAVPRALFLTLQPGTRPHRDCLYALKRHTNTTLSTWWKCDTRMSFS